MKESLEEFYNGILGIESPWGVSTISRDSATKIVTASIRYAHDASLSCPECGESCKLYDHRLRRWRHLDSCNHKTMIEAMIPRVKCPEHGVRQISVSWAEKSSRFTAEFESVVLLWLREDPISTVAENFGLSWDEVDGIMERAIRRGLGRRTQSSVKHIGIDETAYRKRHNYITVILDKDHDVILDVLDDRRSETLSTWFQTQETSDLTGIESISMDMWDPFIKAVRDNFDRCEDIVAFDRFHISQHFCKAVDKVRAQENRSLNKSGDWNPLKRTRYHWLQNSNRTDNRQSDRRDFLKITQINLKTARAWRIKETASLLWEYSYLGVAENHWKRLLGWISRCRLEPIIKIGKMIRKYYWGIKNAIRMKVSNASVESKNSKIQKIKRMACGFRNKARFRNAILFHLGGLDMRHFSTQ